MKTEAELRAKLAEMLAIDGHLTITPSGTPMIFAKTAACKTLLWALGENEDDHWYITIQPGPPLDTRVKARN